MFLGSSGRFLERRYSREAADQENHLWMVPGEVNH